MLLALIVGSGLAVALVRLLGAAGVHLLVCFFVAGAVGSLAFALLTPALTSTDIQTYLRIWLMGLPLVLFLSVVVWLKLRSMKKAEEK